VRLIPPIPRSVWQPRLLDKLRKCGRFKLAAETCGASAKTVRRHILRDKDRLGEGHPEALGNLIKLAKATFTASERERRRREAARRRARAAADHEERLSQRGRLGAAARWGR